MRAQPYQISGTPQSIKKKRHPCGCLGGYFGEKLAGDVLPFLAFAEDVGVGAGTVERDDAYLGVLLVEQ